MSELTDKFREEFKDRETRHIYADDFLNTSIATQLKVLREDLEWTQTKLAEEAGMRQERISVLEDVNYESWSVKTLKRLAKALDLRLVIRFETFGSFLKDFDEFSRDNLKRVSFEQDPAFFPETARMVEAANLPRATVSQVPLKGLPSTIAAGVQATLAFDRPRDVPAPESGVAAAAAATSASVSTENFNLRIAI